MRHRWAYRGKLLWPQEGPLERCTRCSHERLMTKDGPRYYGWRTGEYDRKTAPKCQPPRAG